MIYKTLFVQDEKPPSLYHIKRALLTYDKVLIPHPDDRDLIPPQTYSNVLGFLGSSFPHGPVRPIGKIKNYDCEFDDLMRICKPAIEQNKIEVISTYLRLDNIIRGGYIDIGDYPLNPGFMHNLYKYSACNNNFLLSAIQNDNYLFSQKISFFEEICIDDCNADIPINDEIPLPLIEAPVFNENLIIPLTLVARGRLSSLLKALGYCAVKDIIPFFSNTYQHNIVNAIFSNAANVIDKVAEFDPYWSQRSQTLEIVHNEYLNEATLENLTIRDILKLRTSIWGKQATARDALMTAIADLSKQVANTSDFKRLVSKKIVEYKTIAEKLEIERRGLKLKITCDIGIAAAKTTGAGAISQFTLGFCIPTALIAGCIVALEKLKDYGPTIESLKYSEAEFKKTAGFGMHNFYGNIYKKDNNYFN